MNVHLILQSQFPHNHPVFTSPGSHIQQLRQAFGRGRFAAPRRGQLQQSGAETVQRPGRRLGCSSLLGKKEKW